MDPETFSKKSFVSSGFKFCKNGLTEALTYFLKTVGRLKYTPPRRTYTMTSNCRLSDYNTLNTICDLVLHHLWSNLFLTIFYHAFGRVWYFTESWWTTSSFLPTMALQLMLKCTCTADIYILCQDRSIPSIHAMWHSLTKRYATQCVRDDV